MKTIVSILILLLSLKSSQAQITFPVDVLEGLCDYSLPEFETYMNQKEYYNDKDITNATVTYCRSNEKRSNGKTDGCSMFRSVSKPVVVNVNFSTTDKDYFSSTINTLMRSGSGYKLTKTEWVKMLDHDVPWFYYTSEKYTVIAYFYKQLDNVEWYNVQVSKN